MFHRGLNQKEEVSTTNTGRTWLKEEFQKKIKCILATCIMWLKKKKKEITFKFWIAVGSCPSTHSDSCPNYKQQGFYNAWYSPLSKSLASTFSPPPPVPAALVAKRPRELSWQISELTCRSLWSPSSRLSHRRGAQQSQTARSTWWREQITCTWQIDTQAHPASSNSHWDAGVKFFFKSSSEADKHIQTLKRAKRQKRFPPFKKHCGNINSSLQHYLYSRLLVTQH